MTAFLTPTIQFFFNRGFPGGNSGEEPLCHCKMMHETRILSLGWEDPLEEDIATHSSILAWRIPWTEKPGRQAAVHRVAKSQTWLKLLHMHKPIFTYQIWKDTLLIILFRDIFENSLPFILLMGMTACLIKRRRWILHYLLEFVLLSSLIHCFASQGFSHLCCIMVQIYYGKSHKETTHEFHIVCYSSV